MQPELCQHSVRTERVKPHGFKGKKLNEKENHMRTRAQSYTHTHTHTKKKPAEKRLIKERAQKRHTEKRYRHTKQMLQDFMVADWLLFNTSMTKNI